VKRPLTKLRAWTPAQIAALVFGIWWIGNGVAVFLALPNGATLGTNGSVETGGLSIAVNGWHGIFHLVSGVAGIALCWRPSWARAYVLIIGLVYFSAALWNVFNPTTVLGVIHVDELGSADHAVESILLLAAWLASEPQRHWEREAEGRPGRR
jgi:Domain of unknown function (DUF4383)